MPLDCRLGSGGASGLEESHSENVFNGKTAIYYV